MRIVYWAFVPLTIGLMLALVSPVDAATLKYEAAEVSLVLSAILYASFDRRSSFFVRGAIHLGVALYTFFSWLPFRAFVPFFPDEPNAFWWSCLIWVLIMVSQFFVTCPRCKAFYSLVFYEDKKPIFGSWYAPWLTLKCAKCRRNKLLPNNQECS